MKDAIKDISKFFSVMAVTITFASALGFIATAGYSPHPEDAKYGLGQTVRIVMPGDPIKGRITKVTLWGEMTKAEYDVSFLHDGSIRTLEDIAEWKLEVVD